MGLKDLGSDGGGSSGSKRQYTIITQEEFEDFLASVSGEWKMVRALDIGELVYETDDFAPEDNNIALRVYSTIDKRQRVSRKKGEDAIRLVAYHRTICKPLSGRRKTLRIETWEKNLRNKIEDMMGSEEEVIRHCTACPDGFMVEREGQYGKFQGCTNYPECDNTINE